MPSWANWYFQDVLLPHTEGTSFDQFMIELMIIQWVIAASVGLSLYFIAQSKTNQFKWTHEMVYLEFLWTVLPAVILLWLGIPSLKLLYSHESLLEWPAKYSLTTKVMAHQWYWSYSFNQFNVDFDSFLENSSTLRLLQVNEALVLPMLTNILLLISSSDVLHSFALPPFAIKADANPGRLNSASLNSPIPGVFYGQCSELCGTLHSSMPIVVEMSSMNSFLTWLKHQS